MQTKETPRHFFSPRNHSAAPLRRVVFGPRAPSSGWVVCGGSACKRGSGLGAEPSGGGTNTGGAQSHTFGARMPDVWSVGLVLG